MNDPPLDERNAEMSDEVADAWAAVVIDIAEKLDALKHENNEANVSHGPNDLAN